MSEDEMPTAMEAAEIYRRERLAAEAIRMGRWTISKSELLAQLTANRTFLRERVVRNGGLPEEADAEVDAYIARVEAAPEAASFDDINAQLILGGTLERIQRIGATLPDNRGGLVYGVDPQDGISASERSIPLLDVSIITVTMAFLPLCNLGSILLAHSMAAIDGGLSLDRTVVSERLRSEDWLLADWMEVILAYARDDRPPDFKHYPPLEGARALARIELLYAMEEFALAHEYTHHRLRHTDSQTSAPSRDPMDDEFEADAGAYLISQVLGAEDQNRFATSGGGGVAILCLLDLVRRAKHSLIKGAYDPPPRVDHPAVSDRLAFLNAIDLHLGRQAAAHESVTRAALADLFEELWILLKPELLQLHAEGVRPTVPKVETGGWLPT